MYGNKIIKRDKRSFEYYKLVVEKLNNNSDFWNIPFENLERWEKINNGLESAQKEWKYILANKTREEIIEILCSMDENAIRLRKSAPWPPRQD